MGHQMDVGSLLLSAETQAARVEGILLADPALAGLWRMETSLLEAAASVGLEGERISTQGMVLRLTSGTAMEEDARAAEMALDLPPVGPSIITRVCRFEIGSRGVVSWQARRARSHQGAQASGALRAASGCRARSAA